MPSKIEKILLANQYEILKRIDPERKNEYELLLTALYDGYELDFDQLVPSFSDPIDPEVADEVRDILQMYRALGPKYGQSGTIEAAAKFVGFDGNEETQYYAYARFLLEKRGLWLESQIEDYNTHSPVLPYYRAMLNEWRKADQQFELSGEEIKRIVAKAPYKSVTA